MRAHLARGFVVAKITAQAALLRRAEEALISISQGLPVSRRVAPLRKAA